MDSGTIWGIVGTVIGVGGIVVGLVVTKWRRFYYARYGNTLVVDYKNRLKELSVLYNGQEIENLSITRLAFWNQGNDTISRNDISKIKPLLIKAKNGTTILDVSPVFSSSEACGINVINQRASHEYLLDFEYLDPRKGGVLQVIHTGDHPRNVWLEGEIKGVRKIGHHRASPFTYIPRGFFLLSAFSFILGIVSFVGAIIDIYIRKLAQVGPNLKTEYITYGILVLVVIIWFIVEVTFIPKDISRQLSSLPLDNKETLP
jgi:hypothetical protein